MDPAKKTFLVYGHPDVQPMLRRTAGTPTPRSSTEKDGRSFTAEAQLMTRAQSGLDPRPPVYKECGLELPVNSSSNLEDGGKRQRRLDKMLMDRKDTKIHEGGGLLLHLRQLLARQEQALSLMGSGASCYFFIEIECAAKGPAQWCLRNRQ